MIRRWLLAALAVSLLSVDALGETKTPAEPRVYLHSMTQKEGVPRLLGVMVTQEACTTVANILTARSAELATGQIFYCQAEAFGDK